MCRLTGFRMSKFEVEAIEMIDDLYLAEMGRALAAEQKRAGNKGKPADGD